MLGKVRRIAERRARDAEVEASEERRRRKEAASRPAEPTLESTLARFLRSRSSAEETGPGPESVVYAQVRTERVAQGAAGQTRRSTIAPVIFPLKREVA